MRADADQTHPLEPQRRWIRPKQIERMPEQNSPRTDGTCYQKITTDDATPNLHAGRLATATALTPHATGEENAVQRRERGDEPRADENAYAVEDVDTRRRPAAVRSRPEDLPRPSTVRRRPLELPARNRTAQERRRGWGEMPAVEDDDRSSTTGGGTQPTRKPLAAESPGTRAERARRGMGKNCGGCGVNEEKWGGKWRRSWRVVVIANGGAV